MNSNDMETARISALAAAEAGERLEVAPAHQAELWENYGMLLVGMRWDGGSETGLGSSATDAFTRALTFAQEAEDTSSIIRQRFHLIEAAISEDRHNVDLRVIDEFESELERSGMHAPDMERLALMTRLSRIEINEFENPEPLNDQNRERIDRLIAMSDPGDTGFTIAHRHLVADAIARMDWDGAISYIVDAVRLMNFREPVDRQSREIFFAAYREILLAGFPDDLTSGADHLPEDIRPYWCATLLGRAIPAYRHPPTYPDFALNLGLEGDVAIDFEIDNYGRLVRIIRIHRMAVADESLEAPAARSLEHWRWRPQCDPVPGRTINSGVLVQFRIPD